MKIYDISQELLSCEVYPGDPHPVLNKIVSIQAGDAYNLSTLSLCTHNGTHVDAPSHFIDNGKTVGEMDLSRLVGESYVTEHEGEVGENEVRAILAKARAHGSEAKRILIKGDATVTAEGARTLLAEGVVLVGTESQSVGPADTPMEVHKILLGGEVVLLEGIRLSNVSEGAYFLFCAPINVGASDGAPCRAVLVDFAE